ncbi:hypothetical protein CYLTODRAFT_467810 [Cylindrobasidium torrendii FP15055 ss-10]|uniref:Uncharacterized protein n=1 Tax=Cylindrobasidium torrendii FP15055 ss-10 TaxID=1314674 RepID=A0A0D7B1V0_9AGAR|nr:hypothetical protein CYLTODRAFT_467810 [Cylindrobasidium torrendii FP15055 ss-10]
MPSQTCYAHSLTATHKPRFACICIVCHPKSLDRIPRDVVEALHADVVISNGERELMLRGFLKVSETCAAEPIAELMYKSAAKAANNATAVLKGVPVHKENAPSSKRGPKNLGRRAQRMFRKISGTTLTTAQIGAPVALKAPSSEEPSVTLASYDTVYDIFAEYGSA